MHLCCKFTYLRILGSSLSIKLVDTGEETSREVEILAKAILPIKMGGQGTNESTKVHRLRVRLQEWTAVAAARAKYTRI